MWRSFSLVACLLLVLNNAGVGQQEPLPKFEVASIKLNPQARGPWNMPLAGGKIKFTGDSLKDLIAMAWKLSPERIFGGPAWANSSRYDVLAKAEDGTAAGMTTAQILFNNTLMMRSLLMDRFHLAVHFETRESPIYALVVARKDGKLGPALQEAKADACEEPDLSKPFVLPENGKFPELSCGMGLILYRGRLKGADVELAQLAEFLDRPVGRTVVDKTGLKQKFDIDMEWNSFRSPV